MELIYELSPTQLAISSQILQERKLKTADFLGTVAVLPNGYTRVQNNYFNQMLVGQFFPCACPLNEQLNPKLEVYQINDVYKSLTLRTFCNFNRMGYGKTVETVEHLHQIKASRVLIVAPKAVLEQWRQHIEEWYPELGPWCIIAKSSQSLSRSIDLCYKSASKKLCVILNYEKLLQSPMMSHLRSITWDMIVFDEAHYLKNRRSKRTQASELIPARNRCLLTGTPVMSHYDDLWAMLHILGWKYSGQYYWTWVEKFCEVKEDFFGKKIVGPTRNERDLENFKKYIDLISIRNPDLKLTKGKQVNTITLTMDKAQRTFYNKIKKTLVDELPENLTIANGAVKVVRLRQATSCPHQLNPSEEKIMWGAKFEWIKNFIESTDEQVLILTQFGYTAKLLQEYAKILDPAVHIGSMSEGSKKAELERFKSKQTQILIATTQSIGTGVDGLQQNCRLGIVVDADYSPENNSQAEDRLNRLGQSDLVCWYYLECEKTFDQRVRKINDCKNKSIKELLLSE